MGICDSSNNNINNINNPNECETSTKKTYNIGYSDCNTKKNIEYRNNENTTIYQVQDNIGGDSGNLLKFVTIELLNNVKGSICKIKYGKNSGTGFFIQLKDETVKCLITNNHVINEDSLNKMINLEINNKTNIKLLLDDKNRGILFIKSLDITVIEIIEEDFEIIRNVKFLDYDKKNSNHVKNNLNVFALGYPEEMSIGIGKIIEKEEDHQFYHNIPVAEGASGFPIFESGTEIIIIGIDKGYYEGFGTNRKNKITFIREIVDKIQESNFNSIINKSSKKGKENFIWAEIDINECNKDQEIFIINSFQESLKRYKGGLFGGFDEEDEIKNCEIEIDKMKIPFSFKHTFTKIGKHFIKYSFTKNLTQLRYLFNSCSNITYLNLSNFNTKNVFDMSFMFDGCSSLSKIDLDNLNTENVTDMSRMFNGCKNLIELDLSSFNTKNVSNMNSMFYDCLSLKKINLSSFNTENVTNMQGMFFHCSSLLSLNLSSFNTKNVTEMDAMFFECSNL